MGYGSEEARGGQNKQRMEYKLNLPYPMRQRRWRRGSSSSITSSARYLLSAMILRFLDLGGRKKEKLRSDKSKGGKQIKSLIP